MTTPAKDRFEMRVLQSDKQLVARAAEIEGVKLSRFVWGPAVERAREIVERDQRIETTGQGYEQILEALDNPPEPNPAMIRAMSKYLGTKAR
ncbi:MAG TPA: DUF1778 domain-containing protein [Gammaproteobacteria bacterium]|nr:DUF1778 domain-containing protein [Gammaproteobacteria bacterium]